jgi:hypothetical protein
LYVEIKPMVKANCIQKSIADFVDAIFWMGCLPAAIEDSNDGLPSEIMGIDCGCFFSCDTIESGMVECG